MKKSTIVQHYVTDEVLCTIEDELLFMQRGSAFIQSGKTNMMYYIFSVILIHDKDTNEVCLRLGVTEEEVPV